MTINRVGPVSCARIAGVIYAALGLLIGGLFSLFALLGMAFRGAELGRGQNPLAPLTGAVIGIGAVIAFPIFYGVMGFVFAWIGAWLYNLVASRVGGIEIDIA